MHLREHVVDTGKRYLFVIDGAKALRAAIREVFGSEQPVQRCRTHKLRNVVEQLPRDQHAQVKAVMRAAYRLDAASGMAKLRKLAEWLERDWEAAAHSLLEGLEETFTINTLDIPPTLHRCLATTNIIESPQSGLRRRTRNVTRWRDAAMAKRWAAARSRDLLGRYFQNGFDGLPAQHLDHFIDGQPALLDQLHHRQQLLSAVAEKLGELALARLSLAAHNMIGSSHGGFSFYGFSHLDSKESKGLPPLQLATTAVTPSCRVRSLLHCRHLSDVLRRDACGSGKDGSPGPHTRR